VSKSLAIALVIPLLFAGVARTEEATFRDLTQGFQAPPASAKPHTWWHWCNGNVTRAGITADLEAMQRIGVGGAQIFNVEPGIPHGPVQFMSPQWLELTRFAAQEADRLGLELCIHNCAGWSSSGGPWNTPAHAMQVVVTSELKVQGPRHFAAVLPKPQKSWGFYRDIAVFGLPTLPGPEKHLSNIRTKAAFDRGDMPQADTAHDAAGVYPRASVLNLTAGLKADGTLVWDVPAGQWTILRIGHTPTGQENHPAAPEGTGPECDKLSREAMDAHFAGMVQKVIDACGPLAGKAFCNVLIDSYEVGSQNWTARLPVEFKKRCGYDLTPFLPVYTGRVVQSVEASERFLFDLRRTIVELFAENYFGRLAELCHQHGLKFSTEPYGNGTFEDMLSGSKADIPMGEFWPGGGAIETCKLAGSIGHVYGKSIIGAESFTSAPERSRWTEDPYALKAQGDQVYCLGVNRFIFHRYAMQPWVDRVPGMTMGPWGFHFERTNTWWEPAAAWLKYLARCQYLLQQGRCVADVCYFYGENEPVSQHVGNPPLPPGYDYDGINRDALLSRMTVADGRLRLPNGTTYSVLVLPPENTMTPELLAKIGQLVSAGATVVGPQPERSPSLSDFPRCDATVQSLARAIWGDCDGKTVTEHAYGKGRVVWGKPLAQVLTELYLGPDFDAGAAPLTYIHRKVGETEIYFVANPQKTTCQVECGFRVACKTADFWHPDSGVQEPVPVLYAQSSKIPSLPLQRIPLRLDPCGSVFVVFHSPNLHAGPRARSVVFTATASTAAAEDHHAPKAPVQVLVIRKAVYAANDGSGSVDVTAELQALVRDGQLCVRASNDIKGDPASLHLKQLQVQYVLDGKPNEVKVAENAMLSIPPGITPQDDTRVVPAAFDLALRANGPLEATFWQTGSLQVKTSDRRTFQVAGGGAANVIPIAGPWELQFPPHWGAPPRVTLDKLISWSDHADAGVKYFSGTATYVKDIEISPALLTTDWVLDLDLGHVRNLAHVTLNGKDLGVLWKPPFRMRLAAAQPGKNRLEVKVTNLWPNRLIGDAQLPEDCRWNGDQLAEWPAWLLAGKPSPTGRLTFTTWRHWHKNDPLLESGLLGPVVLRVGQKVTLQ
jgi:hypothetical protein